MTHLVSFPIQTNIQNRTLYFKHFNEVATILLTILDFLKTP